MPRGAQGTHDRQEHKLRARRRGHPVRALPRALPEDPQPHGPGVTPIQGSQWEQLAAPSGLRQASAQVLA